MERDGWIKLHRKMLDNPLMGRPAYRSVWIEILLRAMHNDKEVMFGGKKVLLEPGQFTTGSHVISASTGVPRATVARILKTFENEQQIEQRTDRQCTMITVLKWKDYQKDGQRNEKRVSNERATSEQRVSTKEERNNEKNERMKEEEQGDVALRAPTPSQTALDFFSPEADHAPLVGVLCSKGMQEDVVRQELAKFISYWTEPNKSGTKQRWQMQSTFEVKRRLVTWFGNVNKSAGQFNSQQQPKGIKL